MSTKTRNTAIKNLDIVADINKMIIERQSPEKILSFLNKKRRKKYDITSLYRYINNYKKENPLPIKKEAKHPSGRKNVLRQYHLEDYVFELLKNGMSCNAIINDIHLKYGISMSVKVIEKFKNQKIITPKVEEVKNEVTKKSEVKLTLVDSKATDYKTLHNQCTASLSFHMANMSDINNQVNTERIKSIKELTNTLNVLNKVFFNRNKHIEEKIKQLDIQIEIDAIREIFINYPQSNFKISTVKSQQTGKRYNIVKELDLSNCNLNSIPQEIGHFKYLSSLDVSHNNIKEIRVFDNNKDFHKVITKLNKLNVSNNELTLICESNDKWLEMYKLEHLDLSNNKSLRALISIIEVQDSMKFIDIRGTNKKLFIKTFSTECENRNIMSSLIIDHELIDLKEALHDYLNNGKNKNNWKYIEEIEREDEKEFKMILDMREAIIEDQQERQDQQEN